jgi:hypothetical protein
MTCSGAVGAQFIAGKATRDALFLADVDVTSLPAMVAGHLRPSIGLVILSARGLAGSRPPSSCRSPSPLTPSAAPRLVPDVGGTRHRHQGSLPADFRSLGPILGSGGPISVTRVRPAKARYFIEDRHRAGSQLLGLANQFVCFGDSSLSLSVRIE